MHISLEKLQDHYVLNQYWGLVLFFLGLKLSKLYKISFLVLFNKSNNTKYQVKSILLENKNKHILGKVSSTLFFRLCLEWLQTFPGLSCSPALTLIQDPTGKQIQLKRLCSHLIVCNSMRKQTAGYYSSWLLQCNCKAVEKWGKQVEHHPQSNHWVLHQQRNRPAALWSSIDIPLNQMGKRAALRNSGLNPGMRQNTPHLPSVGIYT